MAAHGSVVPVIRWGARIWGTDPLFWGAFFVEHLSHGSAVLRHFRFACRSSRPSLRDDCRLLAAWRYADRRHGCACRVGRVFCFSCRSTILAIHCHHRATGLGVHLLRPAVDRTVTGVRARTVHPGLSPRPVSIVVRDANDAPSGSTSISRPSGDVNRAENCTICDTGNAVGHQYTPER